jgi:hypothetical protein
METVFQVCAALGGIILVCQLVATLVGFGGDHDGGGDAGHDTSADHDHGGNWFVGILTVKTVTAAVAFFGLGGLTAIYYGAPEPAALGVAVGSAVAALYIVAVLMKSLHQLRAEGTVRMDRAVGQAGTVYLRVPAGRTGPGKVHLSLQNRTVEYQAVTAGAELATGTPVRVVAIVGPDTVEVEAA